MESQRLLMPVVLQLTAAQQLQYARIADELNCDRVSKRSHSGIEPSQSKPRRPESGPAEIEKIIFEILEIADSELRSLSLDDIRRGIAASIACRAAIKVNMKLDQTKMEWLLERSVGNGLPDELPAWTAHRAALLDQGHSEGFSPDLSYSHSIVPGGL